MAQNFAVFQHGRGQGIPLAEMMDPNAGIDDDRFHGLLRKLTLNLLRHDQTFKDTMRGKRIRAALCEKTLETLLKLNISK